MPILLSEAFSSGDSAYGSGSMYPRAKIIEFRHNTKIRVWLQLGDTISGSWVRGSGVDVFEFSITGSDYSTMVSISGSDSLSIYGNAKKELYEWLTEHTRFSGTIE